MEQDAAITTSTINSNKPKGEKGWKIATAIVFESDDLFKKQKAERERRVLEILKDVRSQTW